MKYYTGRGDSGETDTMGLGRIAKDDQLAETIGEVDELNSAIGVAVSNLTDRRVSDMMRLAQDRLFVVGAELASGEKRASRAITEKDVKELEDEIEEMGAKIPEMREFVLPGGSLASSYLHLARSISRRAERSVVRLSKKRELSKNLLAFMNRLSSLLFVAALYMNKREGVEESHPTY